MSSEINDIVDVTILKGKPEITVAGFSTACCLSEYDTPTTRTETYAGSPTAILTAMVAAGHTTDTVPYKQVDALLSGDSTVDKVKLGFFDDNAGSPDADWTAALAAISAYDSDWYGCVCESRVDADVEDVAAWCQTNKKLYVAQTDSADAKSGTEPNIAKTLQDAAYSRTVALWHDPAAEDYLDCRLLGRALAAKLDEPNGQIKWADLALTGGTPDSLLAADRATLHDYDMNTYETRFGLPVLRGGVGCDGEKANIQVSIDWYDQRLTEDLFRAQVATPQGIDIDAGGLSIQETVIERRNDLAVRNGHFRTITLSMPKFEDLQSSDVQAGHVKGITFTAVPRIAVHRTTITGLVAF